MIYLTKIFCRDTSTEWMVTSVGIPWRSIPGGSPCVNKVRAASVQRLQARQEAYRRRIRWGVHICGNNRWKPLGIGVQLHVVSYGNGLHFSFEFHVWLVVWLWVDEQQSAYGLRNIDLRCLQCPAKFFAALCAWQLDNV